MGALHQPGSNPIDLIPFQFKDLGFAFETSGPLLNGITMSVPQGVMVAVLGAPGQAKRTLLRLIGHEIFPTTGEIIIPSHLRILYVSHEIHLLSGSILLNLSFGLMPGKA